MEHNANSGSACPLQGRARFDLAAWVAGDTARGITVIPPCLPAWITTVIQRTPRSRKSPSVSWLSLFPLEPQAALEHGKLRASWEPWMEKTHKPMHNKDQTRSLTPRPRPPLSGTRR